MGFSSPKSGYMEGESPRLRLRRLDNKTGSYPTTNRMGLQRSSWKLLCVVQ